MHRTHIIALGIVAVLLVGGVAPVAAQQTGGAPPTNTSSAPTGGQNTTNGTNTTNTAEPNAGAAGGTNGGSSGGGGGLGGVVDGFDISMYEPKSPVCEGAGAIGGTACDGTVDTLMGWGEAAREYFNEVKAGLITFIVNRPRSMQNGEMAIFGTPTNEPMGTEYDYWRDTVLPSAFALWVLFMILNQFRSVFPMGANSEYARKQFAIKGWIVLGFMIASWGFGQVALHTAHLLSTTLAPGADQLSTDLQSVQADSAAAVFGALAIYFGAGVVALAAALQFVVVYIAVHILLPALPLALVFTLPDFWLFNKLQPVGEKLISWFTICSFYTVPTALVLGIGYPITAALAETMPEMLAFIPGINAASAGLLGILQLVVWFFALIAPLVVFALGSPTRAAGMAAGAVGAFSLGAASGAASGSAAGAASGASSASGLAAGSTASSLPAGVASGAAKSVGTNPISGSSLAGTAGASSSSGGLTSATTSAASTTGSAASATQSASSATGETALASSAHTSGTSTSGPSGASTTTAGADAPDITTVHDRATFDGSRKYEVGVMSGDEFSRFAPNSMRGEAIVDRGRGIQLQEARHGGDSDLVIREEESGELFDVSNIAEKDRDLASQQTPLQQNEHSRNTVFDTRPTNE